MNLNDLVNKTIEEVINYLELRKTNYRISVQDNQPIILTCDYNPTRVNLEVHNGIVTSIKFG